MKRVIKTILLLMIFTSSSHAEWMEEKEAPYEILESLDKVKVDAKGLAEREAFVVYKILNESGRNEFALRGIMFVPDAETLEIVSAVSVTDGVETPVDLKTILVKEAPSPEGGVSHAKKAVIPFTNLQIGSTVKYTYKKKQIKILVDGFYADAYSFGMQAPEANAKVEIKSALPLTVHTSDPWQAIKKTEGKEGEFFTVKIEQTKKLFKVPKELNPVFSEKNVTGVDISTFNSWAKFIEPISTRYEASLVDKKIPPPFLKIIELAKKQKDVAAKVDVVTSELAKVMTYSGNWTTFDKIFFPQPLAEIAKSKTGDCKDFSLATVAMLRNLGLDASVALTLRTSRGPLGTVKSIVPRPDLPQVNMFNHAIVKVKDGAKTLWVDPTNIVSNAGYAFSDIAGNYALEISKTARNLESIPYSPAEKNAVSSEKTYEIKGDNTADTLTKFTLTGDFSKAVIEYNLSKNQEDAQKVLSTLIRTDAAQAKSRFEGIDLKNRISATIAGTEKSIGGKVLGEKDGKTYFFAPLASVLQGILKISGDRVSDLNMGTGMVDTAVLRIKGYDFVGFPEGCTILTPWFTVTRKFLKSEQGFEIRDEAKYLANMIPAKDINSDKFKMAIGDVQDCAMEQNVEVKALTPADTIASRMAGYTYLAAKAKSDVPGPTSVSAARESLHIVENLLASYPTDRSLLVLKARMLRKVGYKSNFVDRKEYLDAADAVLADLEKKFPNDGEVWMQKTWSSYYRSDRNQLTQNFQKAFTHAPKGYELFYLGANVAEKMNNYPAAKGSYLKALSFAKTKAEISSASVGVAGVMLHEQDIENGLNYYRQAIKNSEKEDAWIKGNFVSILNGQSRWDEAIALGEKTLKESPYGVLKKALAESYLGKARQAYQQRAKSVKGIERSALYQEVETTLMKALKLDQECSQCILSLSATYRMQALHRGDKELAQKAISYYEITAKSLKVPAETFQASTDELRRMLDPRSPASKGQTSEPQVSPNDLMR